MKNYSVERKKIKIAIFHCGFIYSGGGERIVLEEAKGLIKRGYEVVVYAPTLDTKKCFPDLVKELNVKTFFNSYSEKLPLRNGFRMIASSLLAPVLSQKFRDVDIFIGANQPGAWIAFCMAKVLRKPYLVYLNQPNRVVYPRPVDIEFGWHSTVRDYHILYKLFSTIRPIIAFLDKLSIIYASRVMVNGSYIQDIIQNVYSVKTKNLPAGANCIDMHKLIKDESHIYHGKIMINKKTIKKPYALITNRHDPQKRFDYVIRALKSVLSDYQNAKLVIPGPYTAHTKVLIKKAKLLGIEDKIFFLGQVSEQDLQKLYRNCCVYCYPSPQEDFGLGPIEAGGWAVPTVAWNHGGPSVTVAHKKTGYLAEPYKVGDYSRYMTILFTNPEIRIKMGRLAWLRTKEIFSWERHLDDLEKSIKKFT